ncbi:MAG: Choline dehydrogenase [Myxococcaceae bacterium]|nr:Choline dehydrogenase [Myxococcaceae bacterium]
MSDRFHFVIVGGGSAGAVIASRLSEDPSCKVALVEAGERPPPAELMPALCAALQVNGETDWAFTADPGGVGRGLAEGRMMVPRGKMLGGSSGLNYLAYVRGHPGDFDAWAAAGAQGWSYAEVLPYFRKSEDFISSADITVDAEAHAEGGPLGVSVRKPVLPVALAFVKAMNALGVPSGDYNGRDRSNPNGVVSLFQTTARAGKRSSTYRAFLEGAVEARENLTILTGAHVTRVLFETTARGLVAYGVEVRSREGKLSAVLADKEVILSAGAVGSPHLLLLSGVGPREELETAGVPCQLDSPHVGKHLKDHLHVGLTYAAKDTGLSLVELGLSVGPDALRAPAGPLPADPSEDASLPPELAALKAEAERRLIQWAATGESLVSSSLYDAAAWYTTGLGDANTNDAQIAFFAGGYSDDLLRRCLRVDPNEYLADAAEALSPTAESVVILANPVKPRSEGELVLKSADPTAAPELRMNYLADPHDLAVMLCVLRRALEVAKHWPNEGQLGPLRIPPRLAEKHGYRAGDEPSDALLEDLTRHYASTVYHLAGTCRMGEVVDARLRVNGVERLRVADASIMPDLISGNTNAPTIMIGEKAAELVARDHGLALERFVAGV